MTKLNQGGIIPVQNPYNFLIKQVPMKKTAIIGIGIAIVIAGIVGIYAASTQEGGLANDSGLGLGDEASVTVEQPKDEEKLGLKDKAVGTAENPEDEEMLDLKDKAGATAENPEDEEKIGLGDKAVATVENP